MSEHILYPVHLIHAANWYMLLEEWEQCLEPFSGKGHFEAWLFLVCCSRNHVLAAKVAEHRFDTTIRSRSVLFSMTAA